MTDHESQSACTDETHHSSDSQFYLTVQNHFLSDELSFTEQVRCERENHSSQSAKQVGAATFLLDLTSAGGALSLMTTH